MSTLLSSTDRLNRRARTLRLRAGIATTFGSLFLALSALLILPGILFLRDALANPLTADAGQILMGSTCVAFALLLLSFMLRERR